MTTTASQLQPSSAAHETWGPRDRSRQPGTSASASPAPSPIALPGVHAAAMRLLQPLPRGTLLDLASGQGAFSLWAQSQGFAVTAVDAGHDGFCAPDIPFVLADLNERFPFEDGSVDYVVGLEVVEHLENAFHFLREVARVLKPGGHALLSTPNEHSCQSRFVYFLTGFYGDSRRVIRDDDEELPMRHINMSPPSQLEFAWRKAGLQLLKIAPSRLSAGAACLFPVLYPLQRLRYATRLRKLCDPRDRATAARTYQLLNRPAMLLARVIVYLLHKPAPHETDLRLG